MYDQDFINDGYADGHSPRIQMVCPACGRRTSTILCFPPREVVCFGMVPIVYEVPRKPGEPRRKACGVRMLEG